MNGRDRASKLFDRFVSGGEGIIDQFIAEQVAEELFIDYKRVTGDGATASWNSQIARILPGDFRIR